MSADDEARRKFEKPRCVAEDVVAFVQENFTLDGGEIDPKSIVELNSYDDRNYYVRTVDGEHEYTIKVHNGVESGRPGLLAAQSAIMRHLNAHGVSAPVPIKTNAGKLLEGVAAKVKGVAEDIAFLLLPLPESAQKFQRAHAVRVLTWIPGVIAERGARVVHTPKFLRDVGEFLGKMAKALESFQHPGAERWHIWDNANVASVRGLAHAVDDPEHRDLVDEVLCDFEAKVIPHASALRRGVCQNDANDQNVVVAITKPSMSAEFFSPGGRPVDPTACPVGILDFGDIVVTWRVNEIAIAAAYFALGKDDPIGDAVELLAGFEANFPLTEIERQLLPTLIAARLVCSCVCGAFSAAKDPSNKTYLLLTQKPGWAALRAPRDAGDDVFLQRADEAARGMEKVKSRFASMRQSTQVQRMRTHKNWAV